jgi:hypothetical protein
MMNQKLSKHADLSAERDRLQSLMKKHTINTRECDITARNLGANAYYVDFVSLRNGTLGLGRIGDVKPVIEAILKARKGK